MRGRLVQAAMEGKLKHGQALLAGFTPLAGIAVDLDGLDEKLDLK